MHTKSTFLLLLFFLFSFNAMASIHYVKQGGAGTKDGTSWANASDDLQAMLTAAANAGGGDIWIAAGMYYGWFEMSGNTNYNQNPFSGDLPVNILGGFPNTGNPVLADRDPAIHITILSGDTGMDDTYTGGLVQNASDINGTNTQVLFMQNVGDDIVFDGLVFNAGSIGGGGPFSRGGGIGIYPTNFGFALPHFINCHFIGNFCGDHGGGVWAGAFFNTAEVKPKFTSCTFSGNEATTSGGGFSVFSLSSSINSAVLVDCTISDNTSNEGGGISFWQDGTVSGGVLTVTNCQIRGNTAASRGGGISISAFSGFSTISNITNTVISGNKATASHGGGIYSGKDVTTGDPLLTTLTNVTLSGNFSGGNGGGIYNDMDQGSPADEEFTMTNVISWNNEDASGVGTANSSYFATSGTTTIVNYSLLQGQNPAGTGNLDGTMASNNPDFMTPLSPGSAPSVAGDFHLQSVSPCIDVGTNTGFPPDSCDVDNDGNITEPTPDLDKQNRIVNSTIDLGPYEYTTAPCSPPTVNAPTVTQPTCILPTGTIVVNASGGTLEYSVNNGVNWQSSATFSGLNPGSYNIKVRLQTDTTCMTSYANNPVVLNTPTGCCTPPTVNAPTVNQPSCAFPTGDITVNASGAGTLEYSIDNGANWQASATFSNLIFGNYDIKVREQADTNCMTSYANNPVVLNPPACCSLYFSEDTPISIQDLTTITSTITVPESGTITDVNIFVIDGTHTFVGDLTFTLTSPINTSVTLIMNECGNDDDFNVALDDQDPNAFNCPISGGVSMQPQNPLSVFNGEEIQGNWVLSIHDNAAQDTGSLEFWGLELCGNFSGGSGCPTDSVLYVNVNAGGANNGSSWTDAYTDLQDALARADTCANITEIWVATGTYKPTSSTDRAVSFNMKNNLHIYGGFNGTETLSSQRNWLTNITILSGDIGTVSDSSDNSYHVIFNSGLDSSAILDGFTIQKGYADVVPKIGGGMLNHSSSPIIANCIFTLNQTTNSGGGMGNQFASSPTLIRCTFEGNTVAESGGGIFNESASSPIIDRCSFLGNTATRGGGFYSFGSSNADIRNSCFMGNAVTTLGGGLFIHSSAVTVMNTSISGNQASSGGGLFNGSNSAPVLTNCIVWGNSNTQINDHPMSSPTVTYSIIEGGYTGTGNLNADPLFVMQPPIGLGTSGDLHLQACSPAKDAGTATSAPPIDFDGDMRPQGSGIDMGYDENGDTCVGGCPTDSILYVNDDATGANNGSSWADAYTDLQDALARVDTCMNITEIWVAAGFYYPTSGMDRTISFNMKNNLRIYGGFNGTETLASQRNWLTNITILSGDIGTVSDSSDNSYHVLFNSNLDSTAVLDGFAIIYGNADAATGVHRFGGGMVNRPNASPTIKDCSFSLNNARFGGAMFNENASSPKISSCIFFHNVTISEGGAMYNSLSASPVMTNCLFRANTAGTVGGALFNTGNCAPTLTNCTVVKNTANNGAGIWNQFTSTVTATNCIFWDNTNGTTAGNSSTFSYSLIEDAACPAGNICNAGMLFNTDPLFVNGIDDFHLQACSPAKDSGTATGAPTIDFDGDMRPQGSGIDMGYDENGDTCMGCPTDSIIYVNDDAAGANNGTSWADAYTDLQDALAEALNCPNVTQIWVAEGIYKPTSGTDRNAHFSMRNNLAILGSFAGTETDPSQRPKGPEGRLPTILSGDIGIADDDSDNSYTVVLNTGLDNTAVLDFFFIRDGNANSIGTDGGGMVNQGNCSPTISRCVFVNNSAINAGGAMYNNFNSSPIIEGCAFINNISTTGSGGAVYNESNSSPILVNCAFQNNTADQLGSAIFNNGSHSTIMNTTFFQNTASVGFPGGGTIGFGTSSTATATNCIFWNNVGGTTYINGTLTLDHSLIQEDSCPSGAVCNTGMIFNTDPLFVHNTNNPRLQACSPARDVATAVGAPLIDYYVNARPSDGAFDMGFAEYYPNANDTPMLITIAPPTVSTITLSAPAYAGTVNDINVRLNGIYPDMNDLTFTLTSPENTSVTLIANQCPGTSNFDIVLDDEAPNPLDCPLNNGDREQPQNPLSAFDGETISGNWILTINDNTPLNDGTLFGWALEFCIDPLPNCPDTLNITGTISSGTYQAAQVINSDGTVPNGANVIFKAGNEVNLDPSFEVEPGGLFEVIMEACTPLQQPPATEEEK